MVRNFIYLRYAMRKRWVTHEKPSPGSNTISLVLKPFRPNIIKIFESINKKINMVNIQIINKFIVLFFFFFKY